MAYPPDFLCVHIINYNTCSQSLGKLGTSQVYLGRRWTKEGMLFVLAVGIIVGLTVNSS
jgi:hypothetical protein